MNLTVKQVSSLEKIRPSGIGNVKEIRRKTVMRGQFFAYQIAISSSNSTKITIEVDSKLKENITMYHDKNVVMDLAAVEGADDDYIEKNPGIMPDMLLPVNSTQIKLNNDATAVWINVKVPENIAAGEYTIIATLTATNPFEEIQVKQVLHLEVLYYIGFHAKAPKIKQNSRLHLGDGCF